MKQLISFLLLGFLLACEDPVQVKLDEGATLLVVDAFINNTATTQRIRLSFSSPFFSDQKNTPVLNAQVLIRNEKTGAVVPFIMQTQGEYTYTRDATQPFGDLNALYSLEITHNSNLYKAQAVLRRSAGIDSVNFEVIPPSFSQPTLTTKRYACRLWAKDSTGLLNDYYWIKTRRNDTLFQDVSDINLSIDGTNGEVPLAFGPPNAFTPPSVFLAFKTYYPKDRCHVEIHSISKDCYLFLLQARNQISNGGLFAQTPENVRTNIITPKTTNLKAVGWFNMAAVTTSSIQIP